MEQTIKNENQSSLEVGPAGRRFKLYYWTHQDLLEKLKEIQKTLQEEKVLFEELNEK
jgi:hypothetical protein